MKKYILTIALTTLACFCLIGCSTDAASTEDVSNEELVVIEHPEVEADDALEKEDVIQEDDELSGDDTDELDMDVSDESESDASEEAAADVVLDDADKTPTEESLEIEPGSKGLIAIDAGHQGKGNYDKEPVGPGATETKAKVSSGTQGAFTGTPEYVLNLEVALLLEDLLIERGYDVLMIRDTHDVNISNSERAKMANDANADAFIRIHANGSDNRNSMGAFTICPTKSNPYCSEIYNDSYLLSRFVLDEFVAATACKELAIWETDTMSGINWCSVPVTIIEMGFMTNETEDRLMDTAEYRLQMATGMANGIDAYIEQKQTATN